MNGTLGAFIVLRMSKPTPTLCRHILVSIVVSLISISCPDSDGSADMILSTQCLDIPDPLY